MSIAILGTTILKKVILIQEARLLFLLLIWIAISLIWSVNPSSGTEKLPKLLASILLGTVLLASASTVTADGRTTLRKLLLVSYFLCLGILIIGILRERGDLLPLLAPHNGVAGDEVWRMNRGATILVLMLLPAFLAAHRQPLLVLLICVLYCIPAMFTESNAALLGFGVAMATIACSRVMPRVTFYAAIGLLMVYILSAPFIHKTILGPRPLETTSFDKSFFEFTQLPSSAQHRVQIWDFTANKILDRPILGWGFNSSRYLADKKDKSKYGSLLQLHPHNGVLEIWLELGLFGAFIMLLLILSIGVRLGRLNPWPERAVGLAFLMATFSISCVAYGIWQSWWVATIFLCSALLTSVLPKNEKNLSPKN
ncbi:MAG: O-antigen ligase family protein [Pseudomonadota bacterium]|nr:O-antigen ligase family protein [Pseudomonadota bacterium]